VKLLEVQKRMANAMFQPLTSSDRVAPGTDTGFIKPNRYLSSTERLEIYSRSYWFRVLDSLYEDFPGLRAVVGQRAFHRLSRAYLADCPSRSFTLRNLGSRLEDWLPSNQEFVCDRYALALDMVRLEWAHIEAFDSAANELLGPEHLLEFGPDSRASLQPYVRLLTLHYGVDDLRIRVNREPDERGATSNAALKQKRRRIIERLDRLKSTQVFLAVHRVGNTVYYRRLAREEHRLLSALRDGLSIGEGIAKAFENSSVLIAQQQSMLETWFRTWSELGWLCPPKKIYERITTC
jgi:hypothetical protein